MKMTNKLIDLYNLYGFEVFDSNENYLIFTFGNGYFSNAEIVLFNEFDTNDIENQLKGLGFSVRVIHYKNFDEIHDRLFNGFFSANITKQKIEKDYEKYCQIQKDRLLCEKYEYLNCDYVTTDQTADKNIVDYIMKKMSSDSAQLVILEAAAGYGKTCTSYEILKRFSAIEISQVPLMTELSRNRKASIFRYVLLSEIDAKFSALSQKVVEYEIRNGNVPLIIDGFDELLSKSTDNSVNEKDAFEETQGMLDTIANLINSDSKAKIMITSRKSAIFTGEKFDEWIDNHDLGEKITRIELKAPQISNWLNYDKIECLKQKGININFVSNPILLSLLRYKDIKTIEENSIDEIINNYIDSVCSRERERQGLALSVEEQKDILAKVAKYFCEFNISAEEDDFVKEIIREIIEDHIDEYILRYSNYSVTSIEEQPDEEEFLMKLLHNAFLDRIIPGKNMIGFINDYSFGYFIGLAVINDYLKLSKESLIDFKYLDLMCTSFMANEMNQKEKLSEKIQEIICCYSVNQQLEICNKLFHKTIASYENETICGVSFSNGFVFSGNCCFKNVVFMNCIFDSCIFECDSFYETQFYNCTFYSPDLDAVTCGNNTLAFLGCSGHEKLAAKFAAFLDKPSGDETFEKIILEQFWKVGSVSPEPRRAFTTIKKGIDPKKLPYIDDALESLIHRNIISKRSVCYELNFSKLSEIRKILGRD